MPTVVLGSPSASLPNLSLPKASNHLVWIDAGSKAGYNKYINNERRWYDECTEKQTWGIGGRIFAGGEEVVDFYDTEMCR